MATDVSAGFPQVDLQPLSVLTVTLSDAGAKITALNVHGFQDDADDGGPGSLVGANPTGAYLPGGG